MDEASARDLLATYRPDLASEPAELIDDGWEFLALAIGDDLIARFPRRPAAAWKLGIEIELLTLVAAALTVNIPVAEFVARYEAAPLFMICRRVPGKILNDETITAIDVDRAAADVARALSGLHALPVQRLHSTGLPMLDVSRWRAIYAALASRIADGAVSERDETVSRRLVRSIDSFLARDELFRFAPSLIHADLGEQIFVEIPSGRVTGIIDWADAQIGDPAHDFGGLLEYGSGFVERVAGDYPGADETLLERARFYDSIAPAVGFVAAMDLSYGELAEICWGETVERWA